MLEPVDERRRKLASHVAPSGGCFSKNMNNQRERGADDTGMTQKRLARRKRAAQLRRARRAPSDPFPFEIRTFTVGDRTIGSVVIDLDEGSGSAPRASGHDCPLCRAVATLEEYEAARAQGQASPELEQRANEAMELLSRGRPPK